MPRREAMLYVRQDGNRVACRLCAHRCLLGEGQFGLCGVRQNLDGVLYTHVYEEAIAAHIDPIEKKPLYHFLPGSKSLSIATIGCNFRCPFCQNWEISQTRLSDGKSGIQSRHLPVKEVVRQALLSDCESISYTYTEPTIFFEYAYETARLAKESGLKNNFVTNGYMTAEALEEIKPYLDAANVDLKFFRDESYQKMCKARLQPVLDSIQKMRELGIWVEVTTLVIPELNDSEEELRGIARFLAGVDRDIPWHLSRFHPDYKYLKSVNTPLATLKRAREIGQAEGLRYVYLGNVWGEGEDTHCPQCGTAVIRREGLWVKSNLLEDGHCPKCGQTIAGIFTRSLPFRF
ncbi:MAG: Radical SAM, Pyruvate-formate lyase-activating enzyme like [Candidatus Saccharicenans subterraneus]|uniref:Radical SAM, Pyruvate-formate lyase-activating enzyme like n=1 Tax=Candidatus Saccharicenans subterraneus TaxID=2508984 RepID=A0A3E2BLD0_9BACT|nr:MAG: Radical SAM, Pyruvate-formate lyase-activating enzyme like [Candidatus Saccharicenans subterraneum]